MTRAAESFAVIGGGIAGTAAAWALRQAGQEVTQYWGAAGATELSTGCWDDDCTEPCSSPPAFSTKLAEFLTSLQLWGGATVQERSSALTCTSAGLLRTTQLAAHPLLDLESCAPGKIAVIDPGRRDWPAALVARSLSEVAERRLGHDRFRFEALDCSSLLSDAERMMPLAALCRQPPSDAFGRQLKERLERDSWSGALCGPWGRLSPRLQSGVPLGEVLSPPEGPAGLGWQEARRALAASCGWTIHQQHITALRSTAEQVTLVGEGTLQPPPSFAGVVLATGGLLGGGLQVTPGPGGGPQPSLSGDADGGFGSTWGWDPALDQGRWTVDSSSFGLPRATQGGLVIAAGQQRRGVPPGMLSCARDGLQAGQALMRSLQARHRPVPGPRDA